MSNLVSVASAPLPGLVVLVADDLTGQGYDDKSAGALMAHRTRRILTGTKKQTAAVYDGSFGAKDIAAMVGAGIIPASDAYVTGEHKNDTNGTAALIAKAKKAGRSFAPCGTNGGTSRGFELPSFS